MSAIRWAVHCVHPASGESWKVAGGYPTKAIAESVARDYRKGVYRAVEGARYVVIRDFGRA